MKFSQLKASIANNEEEAPSIYMAVCMIESLLDDIEDATGREVSDLPAGDDTLPTKLVWLCQVVSQIYKEKNKEFDRNRSRLDTAVGELKTVGAELETLSDAALRLSAVKTDLAKKQAALSRARAEQEEYEKLKEQYRQLQQEADSLRSFDKAAEERKLRALQSEIADLAEAGSGLRAELAAASAARDEAVEKTAGLRSELEKSAALLEQKNNVLSDLEKQRREAQKREYELADRLREATEALSGLQDAVSQLQTEKIPERTRQRDDEEARKNSLEQALESLDLETEQLLEKNRELSARIEKAKEDLRAHNSAYTRLTEDYKQKSEEIAVLANRLEDLMGKNDAQKHGIYKRQMEEQVADLERMGQECAAMEQEIERLDQAVRTKRQETEELSKKKERAEDMERSISDVLRKLEPIASGNFAAKLEANRQRLEMLEGIRDNLSGTLLSMREILGKMPVNDNGAMLDSMKDTLQGLLDYTDRLQKTLVAYARTVTLEERR